MLYAQELIEEIRLQNDIVDVITEYVPLKQKGGSYFGLCPFHNEKTPSFSVNSEKQFFYCFGCGAAGNVYSFIMQIENCDFVEAVKRLAQRAHITLPEPEYSPQAKEAEQQKQRLYEIHKTAGRFYYTLLHNKTGALGLSYLEKRQIQPNIQKKFGIGYSPLGRQELFHHLKGKGFSITDMLKSGLVMENKDKKGYHDRFYHRLMFPIFDVSGKVIAFGGRMLEKGEPKYLNSPETILFHKSKTLYGLNFARQSKKKELIIVEGYLDMITIYQAGYHNVAASLGTAFGTEHARLLRRFVQEVILLYDSDEAGTNAALRAIPVLVANGIRIKVVQVPNGKDPDDYIKQYGPRAFGKLLYQAKPYISFQIDCVKKKYNIENTEHKILFTTEAAQLLSNLQNDIERDAYIKELANMTGIEELAIKSEVIKFLKKEDGVFQKKANEKKLQIYDTPKKQNTSYSKGILQAQRDILYLCANDKNIYYKIKNYICPKDFLEDVYCRLAEFIFESNEKNKNIIPGEAISLFESKEEQKMAAAVFANSTIEKVQEIEKAINEELKLLKRAKIDQTAASAVSIDDIKNLLEEKRKLDGLHITISDG